MRFNLTKLFSSRNLVLIASLLGVKQSKLPSKINLHLLLFNSFFLNTQSMMKFTKAQKEILLTLENGDEVLNWSQRMRALQPLIDAGIVYIKVTNDKNGITEDVRIALVD